MRRRKRIQKRQGFHTSAGKVGMGKAQSLPLYPWICTTILKQKECIFSL